MVPTREELAADEQCVRRVAEQFLRDQPRDVQTAVGRTVTTDAEFEGWRWDVLAPYVEQVVDRCEGNVSRLYGVGYFVGAEQHRIAKTEQPRPSPETRLWSAAATIVKAALYRAHGRDWMLAYMSGSVMIDSVHPREENRRR